MNNEPIITEAQLLQRADMEKSMVATPHFDIDLLSEEAIDLHIKKVEGMMTLKSRIIETAVKQAKPSDIRGMGKGSDEKPHFCAAFCEQIFAMLGGGKTELLNADLRQEEDGNFSYCVLMRISHPVLGSIDCIGQASSRDQFLGSVPKKVWDDKLGKKVPVVDGKGDIVMTRTLDEVSEHNLQQHARTRAVGSGIRKILGIGNCTWAQLEAMGFDRNESSRTTFDKKPSTSQKLQKLRSKLHDYVNKGTFTWAQIQRNQKDLGLGEGRAIDLAEDETEKLIRALDIQAKPKKPEASK